MNGRHAKVIDHLNLAAGIAGGTRDNRHPDLLRTVMEPESPREKTIVYRILEDIIIRETNHRQVPCNQFRPVVKILPGVSHHGRFSCCPRGGVNPHDLLHGDSKEPERVAPLQVGFFREGQFLHIFNSPDVIRAHPRILEQCLVERHLQCLFNRFPESFCLKGTECVTLQSLHLSVPVFHSDNQLIVPGPSHTHIICLYHPAGYKPYPGRRNNIRNMRSITMPG